MVFACDYRIFFTFPCVPSFVSRAHDFEGSFVHLLPLIRKKNHPRARCLQQPRRLRHRAKNGRMTTTENVGGEQENQTARTTHSRRQPHKHGGSSCAITLPYYTALGTHIYAGNVCKVYMCICMKCMRVWVSVLRCASDSVLGDNVGGRRCLRT